MTTPNTPLRDIIKQAVTIYEATRLAELQTQAEQQQAGELVQIIQQTAQAARDLLEKAGLAHIVGALAKLKVPPAPMRLRPDVDIAQAFATAQLAQTELRTSAIQLAVALLQAQQWSEAHQLLQAMNLESTSPFYAKVLELLCESYYAPAVIALKQQAWQTARQNLESVLKINPNYQDAANLLRETYLRPAKLALENKQWQEARPWLIDWLKVKPQDEEAHNLHCQSYYAPAKIALEQQAWLTARQELEIVLKINPTYQNTTKLLRESYVKPATLKNNDWPQIVEHLTPWVARQNRDKKSLNLLCEAHYQLAQQATQAKNWSAASQHIKIIMELNQDYPNIPTLLQQNPVIAWWSGFIKQVAKLDVYLAIQFDEKNNLVADLNGYQDLYQVETWKKFGRYQIIKPLAHKLITKVFNSDGSLQAICSLQKKGAVEIWGQNKYLYTLKNSRGNNLKGQGVAFSPDEKWLAVVNYEGKVLIFGLAL